MGRPRLLCQVYFDAHSSCVVTKTPDPRRVRWRRDSVTSVQTLPGPFLPLVLDPASYRPGHSSQVYGCRYYPGFEGVVGRTPVSGRCPRCPNLCVGRTRCPLLVLRLAVSPVAGGDLVGHFCESKVQCRVVSKTRCQGFTLSSLVFTLRLK